MLEIFTRREAPSGPAFGFFCAVGALVMAAQTVHTYRNGFMYCGFTEKVYRKDNPKKFNFWFGIQISFVLLLIAGSVYGFLS
jgi:hypothetical protein